MKKTSKSVVLLLAVTAMVGCASTAFALQNWYSGSCSSNFSTKSTSDFTATSTGYNSTYDCDPNVNFNSRFYTRLNGAKAQTYAMVTRAFDYDSQPFIGSAKGNKVYLNVAKPSGISSLYAEGYKGTK